MADRKPWVRCSSLVEDLPAAAALSPPRAQELRSLKHEATELDRETAEFDRQVARLREENVCIVRRLAGLKQDAGTKEGSVAAAATGTGTGTSAGKSLLRSSSAKHDSGVQGLLEACERNQAELCRLDAAQRRLLNKCFSFDNRVEAFRRSGK